MTEITVVENPAADEAVKESSTMEAELEPFPQLHPLVEAVLFWIRRTFQNEEREVAAFVKKRHPKGFRAKDSCWAIFHGMVAPFESVVRNQISDSVLAYDEHQTRKKWVYRTVFLLSGLAIGWTIAAHAGGLIG